MRHLLLTIGLFASGCLDLDDGEGELGETESSVVFCDNCTPEAQSELLLKPNLSGAKGSSKTYTVHLNAMRPVRITISGGTGDADLYVRRYLPPALTLYDCRPYLSGNNESCLEVPDTLSSTYYITVYGYESYTGVTLTAKYEY